MASLQLCVPSRFIAIASFATSLAIFGCHGAAHSVSDPRRDVVEHRGPSERTDAGAFDSSAHDGGSADEPEISLQPRSLTGTWDIVARVQFADSMGHHARPAANVWLEVETERCPSNATCAGTKNDVVRLRTTVDGSFRVSGVPRSAGAIVFRLAAPIPEECRYSPKKMDARIPISLCTDDAKGAGVDHGLCDLGALRACWHVPPRPHP